MKVSVIIPVYNAGKYLETCLESIGRQSLGDFEAIIIDDGSVDGSGRIADNAAAADPRFRVFHRSNHGVSASRNFGLEKAQGEFISFVDSDDSIDPSFLEKLFAAIGEADFAFCDILLDSGAMKDRHKCWTPGASMKDSLRNALYDGWCGAPWNKLYRKSFLDENALRFPEGISYSEDLLFVVKAICLSRSVSKVDEALYIYNRANDGSATHSFSRKHETDCFAVLEMLEAMFREQGLWEEFHLFIEWRMLLNKVGIVFDPDRLREFNSIHPEVNSKIWSNPFLHRKLRILMSILRLRLYPLARLAIKHR